MSDLALRGASSSKLLLSYKSTSQSGSFPSALCNVLGSSLGVCNCSLGHGHSCLALQENTHGCNAYMLQRYHEFFEFVGLSGLDIARITHIVRRCRSFQRRLRLRRLRWNTALLYPLAHLSTCAVGGAHTLNARVTHIRYPRSPTPTLSPIHTKATYKRTLALSDSMQCANDTFLLSVIFTSDLALLIVLITRRDNSHVCVMIIKLESFCRECVRCMWREVNLIS